MGGEGDAPALDEMGHLLGRVHYATLLRRLRTDHVLVH